MGFLDRLKTKKATIGISISQKGILEVAEFDFDKKKVLKYTNSPINYNVPTRQFDDISELEYSIRKSFEELGLPLNSQVFLSLPTTLISHITLPNILDEESIKMALISEVEKSYVFKKSEPQVSYLKISENAENETSFIAFSPFQIDLLQQIKEVFDKIGINVLAIDTSYASLIRGIIESGMADKNLQDEINWNILLINTNSYVIFSMIGDKLIEVYEDPIAIKSFSEDEIYPAITSAASSSLMNYMSEDIIIISESDDVSAEILSNYFNVNMSKSFIENNKYTQKPIVEYDLNVLPSKAPMISPEIIGILVWEKSQVSLKFNFNENSVKVASSYSFTIGEHEINITAKLLQNIAIGCIVFSLTVIGILWYGAESILSIQTRTLQEVAAKMSELEMALKSDKSNKVIPSKVIEERYLANKNIIMSYDSLAIDIPEKLWLQEFEVYSDLSAYIKGQALKMEDVLNYYESLQKLGRFNNLKISSLKIINPAEEAKSTDVASVSPAPGSVDNVLPAITTNFNTGEKMYEFVFGEKKAVTPATSTSPGTATPTASPPPVTTAPIAPALPPAATPAVP
jgi:hypothetical protein